MPTRDPVFIDKLDPGQFLVYLARPVEITGRELSITDGSTTGTYKLNISLEFTCDQENTTSDQKKIIKEGSLAVLKKVDQGDIGSPQLIFYHNEGLVVQARLNISGLLGTKKDHSG